MSDRVKPQAKYKTTNWMNCPGFFGRWADASLAQMTTALCKVIALVGVAFFWAALRPTGQARNRWYRIDKIFEDNRVVPISPGHHHQRKTAPVYDEMAFAK